MEKIEEGVRAARNGRTPEALNRQVKDRDTSSAPAHQHQAAGFVGLHGLRDPLDYSREEGIECARRLGAYACMLEDAYALRDDEAAGFITRRCLLQIKLAKHINTTLRGENTEGEAA